MQRELHGALSHRARYGSSQTTRSTDLVVKTELSAVMGRPISKKMPPRAEAKQMTAEQRETITRAAREELANNSIARRVARVRTKFSKKRLSRLTRGWLRAARCRLGAQRRTYVKEDAKVEADAAWTKYRREGEQWRPPAQGCGPPPKKDDKARRKERKQRQKVKKKAAQSARPALPAPSSPPGARVLPGVDTVGGPLGSLIRPLSGKAPPWRTAADGPSAPTPVAERIFRGIRRRYDPDSARWVVDATTS